MSVLSAFRTGLTEAVRAVKLFFLCFVVMLLLAFPSGFLFHSTMEAAFDSSMTLTSPRSGLDYTAIHDLLHAHGEAISTVARLLTPIAALGALLNLFLAGGIFEILIHGMKFSLGTFFRGCGCYFGRFLRIWLILAGISITAFFLLSAGGAALLSALNAEADSERTVILRSLAVMGALAIPFLLLLLASDYAKVSAVIGDTQSSWNAVGDGLIFLIKNFVGAISLRALFLAIVLLCGAAYWELEGILTANSLLKMVGLVLLQQLFVGVRLWSRLAAYAGAIAFYRARRLRPVILPGWDNSPAPEPL
jgi:hypothetical protein